MKKHTAGDLAGELVVTMFGLGRLPVAPGTWGTAGAAVVHALVACIIRTHNAPATVPALAFLFTVASVLCQPWAERHYGRRDPPWFVIDEAAGYFLSVSFFPHRSQLLVGVFAFCIFRVFDILKPFPIRRAENTPGGIGIVLDDLVAGAYTGLVIGLLLLALDIVEAFYSAVAMAVS